MKRNVGSVDRGIRIVVALGLFSLIALLHGPIRWVGLIGVVPLLTAFVAFCPLYGILGVRTCK